jgi:hypothetical protein
MNKIIVVEATGQPLAFPDARAEARARAQEFQRLSPEARFQEIFALMALGLNMARSSPRREAIEQRWLDEEQAFRQVQREVFAKHGQ